MEHYIIVKYKNDIAKDRNSLHEEIACLFKQALHIDGIHLVRIIKACMLGPKRYDLMIHMVMEKEALLLFDQSDIHAKWKKQYGIYIENKVIFDGE